MPEITSKGRTGLVLLIDPIADSKSVIAESVQQLGYQIQCVRSGEEGLYFWQQYLPEVVVCDVSEDHWDGLAVLRAIAASEQETQVIMVSAAGRMDDVVAALRLGAADFLLKPISDPEVLNHAINRAFEEHQLNLENRLYREALEKKNQELKTSLRLLKEDQEAGRAVQLKLLPENKHSFGSIDIEYKIIPSLYLSGDFVDYFGLGDGRVGFYLADVSGHGASSAFVTVLLKTVANRVRHRFSTNVADDSFPEVMLRAANDELLPLGLGKHLAVFCGYIDLATRRLTYCSAAHFPPPILQTNNEIIALEGRGLPVGLFEGVHYDVHEVSLGESFALTLFSDGILELMPQSSVAEKESYLVEIVTNGIHNIDQLLKVLDLDFEEAVPDDVAVMTITGTT